MGRLLPAALLLFGLLLMPSVASAQEYNHIITVYAVVPEQRVVYLDESGNLMKVAGNTDKNITPTVLDPNNKEVPITPAVQQQYDNFLKQHHNKLQASIVYNVNPIAVNLTPNTQTIDINTSYLTLGNLKTD
jgi:hypothetical protein